jgi:glycosyltransferase involved in cell wall biosynthesis
MKIAFLTPEYPHLKTGSSGGIGTSIRNLAIGLLAEGCSVRVLVYGQKEESLFEDNGIVVQQIRNVKLKGLSWYLTRKKLQKIIDGLYENKEIDVVEAPDWTGITSFISPKKCPIVIRLNGSDTYFCHLDQRPVKWKNKFHERRALLQADGLLSVSQFTADTTNTVFGLDKKFTIIPNGIDMELFIPEKVIDEKFPVASNSLLYFGSLIRKKGLLELPFIFNAIVAIRPEATLLLIGKDVPDIISGNPSTWQMMQDLFTTEAKSRVQYLGSVPYVDIKRHINEATVCLFPTFAEALPVSWIEAMAMQKPIVASNIGWAKEVIADCVNGFLVHPTDHDAYADKTVLLLDLEDLRTEFGLAARDRVAAKFSIEVVAEQSKLFYESLIP